MASALSATLSALKTLPAAMDLMKAARSAMPVVRSQSPAAMKGLGQALSGAVSQSLKGAQPGGGKSLSPMSQMLSALSKVAPHVAAMSSKSGLGKAMQEGMKAARELSKMGDHARSSGGGKGGSGALGGGGTSVRKAPGFQAIAGPVKKNWEEATAANGFREIASGKLPGKDGAKGRGFKLMMGPIEKNWEKAAKPEEGFREIGRGKLPGTTGGPREFKVMLGPIKKNWEEAAKLLKRESEGGKASGGEMRRARSNTDPGPGAHRFGALSEAAKGQAKASQSRQRANAFSGVQRKQGGAFPLIQISLGAARSRGSGSRSSPRMSLQLGINASGISVAMHLHSSAHGPEESGVKSKPGGPGGSSGGSLSGSGRRARANTI